MGAFDAIIVNIGKVTTPVASDLLRRQCVVSSGDSSVTKDTIQMVTASDWKTYVTGTNETSKWLESFFAIADNKVAYIFECSASGDAATRLKALQAFIQSGVSPCYKYALPQVLYKDPYLATLLALFSTESSMVYFSAIQDTQAGTKNDPTQQPEYTNWKGQKSFMSFYPSLTLDTLNIDGLVSGVMASNSYDIGGNTPMSPLDRKHIIGSTKEIDDAIYVKIKEANCVVSENFQTYNRIQNGKMADGTEWEKRYSQDYLVVTLQANIEALFDTASNNAGYEIKYNDNGILSVKENLVETLKTLRNLGVVNRFGKSINLATQEIAGIDDVAYIPFVQYKKDNPAHYKAGIYGGYSAYVEIQGFIKQIIFNVTIG